MNRKVMVGLALAAFLSPALADALDGSAMHSEGVVNVQWRDAHTMEVQYSRAATAGVHPNEAGLPVPHGRFIAVPAGAGVSISSQRVSTQELVFIGEALSVQETASEAVAIGEEWRQGAVSLIPISFSPVIASGGGLRWVREASATIELPPDLPDWGGMSGQLRRALRPILLNPPARDDASGQGEGTYVYVIPNDDRVSEAIAELVGWRRLQGFTVREIRFPAWADAAFIYDIIRDIHQRGPAVSYICLVGDQGGGFSIPSLISGTSDYSYGILSGNGPLPDAAVGRLSYNSIGELQRMAAKILSYEREPNREDIEWLRRGAVAAGNHQSGYSTILVSRWLRDYLLRSGYSAVDTFYYTMNGGVQSFMEGAFGRGCGFISYRGWTGMEDWTAREIGNLNNRRLPVALFLGCNTGDFDGPGAGFTEALLRADGGAIGAVGSVGSQSRVSFNNALLAGYFRGVLEGGVTRLGWTVNRAKLELFAAYGAVGREWVASHAYWTNLMGDPGTVVWTGAPRDVQMELPNQVTLGESSLTVRVTADGQPVAGVQVGFYRANSVSGAAVTNSDGQARIVFDPRMLNVGQASVTVSGDRVMPLTRQLNVVAPQARMQYQSHFIQDDDNDPREGNGNGVANPFETIGLTAMLRNVGVNVLPAGSRYELTTEHPGAQIVQGLFIWNQPVAAGGVVQAGFLVRLTNRFPDNQAVPFNLRITSGENQWTEALHLTGAAPRWAVARLSGNIPMVRGREDTLNVFLRNPGRDTLRVAAGVLTSPSQFVEIVQGQYEYRQLSPGDTAGQPAMFRLNLRGDAPFGSSIPFNLDLTDANGYLARLSFTVPVTPVPAYFTTGPDAYGYYAIDDRDSLTNLRPAFNWVEINPRLGGQGTDAGLLDQGEDDDKSAAFNLPFRFRYYGVNYDKITICTNGWAALGDQRDYVDFRNTPIGAPQGPLAQICPFWDDLYQPGAQGGVFTWYDEPNHRFIVEWYRMRRYIGPMGPGAVETFQLILRDPRWHPTTTGDGDILFQYLDITLEALVDGNGTPYPTVGIGDPQDRGGLQYGYWNRWAVGAAPIARGSAVRFSTAASHSYAVARGTVNRLEDGQPLQGAVVRCSNGGWAVTDLNGSYRIANVLASRPFTLEATLPGYNAQVSGEMQVNVGDSVTVRLDLRRPAITINVEAIGDTLDAGDAVDIPFNIQNQGNGTLDFSIRFEPPQQNLMGFQPPTQVDGHDEPDEPWQRLFGWSATDSTGDHRLLGAAFTGENFILSGGNNGAMRNLFYHADRRGINRGRSFQPCESLWGMHDLAWDGQRLYGGCDNLIYEMNFNGELVRTIPSPLTPPRGLAVDPANGDIWVVNDGDPIHRMNRAGEVLARYPHRLRPYGLAWHPADPDGYALYIFSADGRSNLAVSKLNPSNGDILAVAQIELREGDRAGGCELTMRWDTHRWTLVTLIQNPAGDRVELFDAGPNLGWVSAAPRSGRIQPNGQVECLVSLNSDGLEGGLYQLEMVITHNAAGGVMRVPIRLFVEPELAAAPGAPPRHFELTELYPNPTNSVAVVEFALPRPSFTRIDVFDLNGRRALEVFNGALQAGRHRWALEVGHLPSSVYLIQLSTGNTVLKRKFVLLK